MIKIRLYILAGALVLFGATSAPMKAATPCDGIDRHITNENKTRLASVIASQLKVTKVDILESLRSGGWTILYVDSHEADDAFLFFSMDPATHHYVTLWSGAAMSDEEKAIRAWTIQNAPGIPSSLASCFAWHVTNDPSL